MIRIGKLEQKDIDLLINKSINYIETAYFRDSSLYFLGYGIETKKIKINSQQVEKLIPLLNDKNNDKNYQIYNQVTYPIREAVKINNSPDLVSNLKKIAENKEENWKTRIGVAQALGYSGYDVKLSLKVLTEAIQDQSLSPTIQKFAIESIEVIAELPQLAYQVADKEDLKKDWRDGLKLAQEVLNNKENNIRESNKDQVIQANNSLNNAIQSIPKPANPIWTVIIKNPKIYIPIFLIFLLSLWLFLLFYYFVLNHYLYYG